MKEIAEEESNDYVVITQAGKQRVMLNARGVIPPTSTPPLLKKMLILADGANLKIWITVLI
jgi:hypothetical protein